MRKKVIVVVYPCKHCPLYNSQLTTSEQEVPLSFSAEGRYSLALLPWGGEWVFDVDGRVNLHGVKILRPEHMASRVLGGRQDAGVPVVDLVAEL